ncbi:3,4-dihydroxy-2-butanone-4-phosphate synthase, partial [Amycolatopsis sp. NPDC051372]|uniref:3,4-dihydroxy-2-butanone-4-phosphate synthase n=1 Tax=unclassified Amycolatopsis TaxID=2618356 RepID=UPI00341E19A9
MSETKAAEPRTGWTPCGAGTVFDADAIEAAVADIAAGRAVVVVDDEDRENEGDLIFAAEKATP